jgi:hypothetical protein
MFLANYYNKKLITISPGGIKGFYMFGICKFIKNNYNLDNYIFSGASCGSWLSLLLCFNGDIDEFQKYIIDDNINKINSLKNIEDFIKNKILIKYNNDNFDLEKLNIGLTTIHNCKINTNIFSNFTNLEDAIDCCIASSHIPFITGGLSNKYHNKLTYDGAFSEYPYIKDIKPTLHITPTIFKKKSSFISMLIRSNNNFIDLINEGYEDSKINKKFFDSIFIKNLF